ncbi:hypothetical protein [Brevundimonas sp.]|uniref:hypothetical protein n=1 Tax=Brevundimonas sp. TaxID=1871086 RepID=UPI0025BC8FEA|nr:hypothetical protein [Brevundimonas sp.]
MSARQLWRLAGPAGRIAALVLALGAALLLAHGLGFRWDPFDRAARRLAAAEARATAAESDAAARRLEREAAVTQSRRLDIHHQQALALERATARAEAGARNAHDAEHPLDPDRIGRLSDHDRRLCDLAPEVCAAAPAGPAVGGDEPLPAGPAAGPADAG